MTPERAKEIRRAAQARILADLAKFDPVPDATTRDRALATRAAYHQDKQARAAHIEELLKEKEPPPPAPDDSLMADYMSGLSMDAIYEKYGREGTRKKIHAATTLEERAERNRRYNLLWIREHRDKQRYKRVAKDKGRKMVPA